MRRIDLDPERLQAVAQLLADYPELDVDRVRSLVESPAGRRRRGLTLRRGPARKPRASAT
jgi:ribosomal 50S subunit-associated protein YjgA (DUF615 family)